jgi:hypothetical protein
VRDLKELALASDLRALSERDDLAGLRVACSPAEISRTKAGVIFVPDARLYNPVGKIDCAFQGFLHLACFILLLRGVLG